MTPLIKCSEAICFYCGRAIKGKPKKVGPDQQYCDVRCFVYDAYKNYPGTSLAKMLDKMYPELVGEKKE
jgi:hypothetical protein